MGLNYSIWLRVNKGNRVRASIMLLWGCRTGCESVLCEIVCDWLVSFEVVMDV